MSVFSKQQDCECCVTSKTGFASPKELQDIVIGLDSDTQYSSISQDKLYDGPENYIRLQQDDGNNPVIAILNKIQTGNKQLAEIANVNQGIVSGADSVSEKHLVEYHIEAQKNDGIFVLNKSVNKDIATLNVIANAVPDGSLVKPFFKNSDIQRYITTETAHRFILFMGKDLENETKLQEKYPTIYEHLIKFKPIMVDKRLSLHEKTDQWFTLNRGTAHPTIFNGPKIVAPQRSARNTFGYNESSWYAASDVFFITSPKQGYSLKYILGLLNSQLYYFWLYHKGKRKGSTLELTAKPISEIPILLATVEQQTEISNLVTNIISALKKDTNITLLEKELNKKIYKLYDITTDEQKLIESLQ